MDDFRAPSFFDRPLLKGYRFSGYYLVFQNVPSQHSLTPGTTLQSVVAADEFDLDLPARVRLRRFD